MWVEADDTAGNITSVSDIDIGNNASGIWFTYDITEPVSDLVVQEQG